MKRLGALGIGLAVAIGLTAFVVLMGSLVFPGALKWAAGSVCDADKPDTLVVRDNYQTEPGETSTNFTLYCIGPRGETQDAGFAKPLGVLILWASAAASIVVVAMWVVGIVRRAVSGRGSDGGLPPPPPSGPLAPDPELEDYGGQPPLIS